MAKYTFTNSKNQTTDEAPKGFVKQMVLEVDGKSIENPVYCNHKRGKNWSARMDGPNAADAQRTYLRTKGRVVDLQQVKEGDAFVVAGDYITSGGNYQPDRIWAVINRLDDDELVLDVYETEAKAISARNKGWRATAVPEVPEVDVAAIDAAFPVGFNLH